MQVAANTAPAMKAPASAAQEVPAAAKHSAPPSCDAKHAGHADAGELPQMQLTAGHTNVGAHAGQPARRLASRLPLKEQLDDHKVAAKNESQPTMNRTQPGTRLT